MTSDQGNTEGHTSLKYRVIIRGYPVIVGFGKDQLLQRRVDYWVSDSRKRVYIGSPTMSIHRVLGYTPRNGYENGFTVSECPPT